MKSDASVSVDILYALDKYSENNRININKIYKDARIDIEKIINENKRVPVEQFHILWEAVNKISGDDNFGLHVALASIKSQKTNNILYSILYNSANIEHAIRNLIRYHDLSSDFIKIWFETENNNAVLSWNSIIPVESDRNYSDCVMALLVFLLSDLSNNKIKIKEINLIHDKPEDTAEYLKIFKYRINFGKSGNEVVFSKDDLALQIKYYDKDLLASLEKYASGLLNKLHSDNTFTEEVYHLINEMFSKGETPSIEKVAGKMALTVRNLQHKLRKENISYKIILDLLRKEISLEYLKSKDTVIYELAYILGFSEQSSFNHAFKKWTGISPRIYQLKNGNN